VILEARQLSFAYHGTPVLHGVDIAIRPGVTAILGPNASGKSTLLRCLCGLLKPTGDILLDERPLPDFHHDALTRIVSYLPQNLATHAVLSVFETVLLGRVHQLRWRVGADDVRLVQELLDEFQLSDIGDRCITELSGGQMQMVAIAQALAREPTILLLDEPNASLDLHHQFDISARIRRLTAARGISTALSVHDINMAARIADTVCVLEAGRIRCSGTPRDILTEEMIAAVYHVSARVTYDEEGRPLITPMGLRDRN
jgi:iron complex transport system ATP-binding protein